MNETLMTQSGFTRAIAELERLKASGRREIAERIRHALLAETNPSENSEYLDAREEQMRLELKIAQLEQRLSEARLVEPNRGNGVIDVGERVRLHDLDSDEQVEYELVGSFESDPAAGRISAQSPLGRALLGRREGEVTTADAPQGRLQFKILEIEVPTTSTG